MGKRKKGRRSIALHFSAFTVGIILFQSFLLVLMLVVGGVVQHSRESAYAAFYSNVKNRARAIQSEMDNRWTNIDPYVGEVSGKLPMSGGMQTQAQREQFLSDISGTLISMLRVTGVNGSFVVLDSFKDSSGVHAALYFRDYDPSSSYDGNSDLYLALGSSDLSQRLKIPLDSTWHYGLALNGENESFYRRPYEASQLSGDYKKLGYWSAPFSLNPGEGQSITYSVPLFDRGGQARGVIGVGVTTESFQNLLPANELTPRDSLGYLVAVRQADGGFQPIITKGGYQSRVLQGAASPAFEPVDEEHHIYLLTNGNSKGEIYACMENLNLYNRNAPYDEAPWVVIGLMEGDKLFAFVKKLHSILLLSFAGSLVLCTAAGCLLSRRMTRPIVGLASKVRSHDFTRKIELERTGLAELDDLAKAVEVSNQGLLESTVRISQIMALVNVKIGAFEYRGDGEKTLVTEQLFELMGLEPEEGGSLYLSGGRFMARFEEIVRHPEEGEEHIYLAGERPDRWLKICVTIRGGTWLGVVSDVTGEILEKRRLRFERDFDSLTKLYTRGAFRARVEQLLRRQNLGVAALAMLDLDYLKQINDTHGHNYGDIYIRRAADLLAAVAPQRTVAGRRSGDEFYLFFYGYQSKEEIREEMRRFYRSLDNGRVPLPGGELFLIRISSGISWYGDDADSFETLARHADSAMYRVKRGGKGFMAEFSADADRTADPQDAGTA